MGAKNPSGFLIKEKRDLKGIILFGLVSRIGFLQDEGPVAAVSRFSELESSRKGNEIRGHPFTFCCGETFELLAKVRNLPFDRLRVNGIPGTPYLSPLPRFISNSVLPLWTRRLLQQPTAHTLLQPNDKSLTAQRPACFFMLL